MTALEKVPEGETRSLCMFSATRSRAPSTHRGHVRPELTVRASRQAQGSPCRLYRRKKSQAEIPGPRKPPEVCRSSLPSLCVQSPPSNPPPTRSWEFPPQDKEAAKPPGRALVLKPTPHRRLPESPSDSGSLARGRLILLSKLYKILILQSGNLGGKKTQQWENVGYAALDIQFSGDQL